MSQKALKYYTSEDYLAMEREATNKHEYYRGEIFAMSGTSYRHNVIQINLLVALGNHLVNNPCMPFGNDLRVHIPQNSLYTYPDLLIVCDEPRFADDKFDTLLNPSVIVEILSPSTANYDRGAKFDLYRDIESLQEYVLIDSSNVHFMHYVRNANNTWTLSEAKTKEGLLEISRVQFTTPLSEIYKNAL